MDMPEKENDKEILKSLRDIYITLERAHPKKDTSWHHRFYEGLTRFAKYIGAPALVLAAILPVINLFQLTIDTNNKKHFKSVYESYVHELLMKGEMDRANNLLLDFENREKQDIKIQYLHAKLLIERAIKLGVYPEKAEDGVKILLALNKNKPFLFPSFGGASEDIFLSFSLVDIYTQTQDYSKAYSLLEKISKYNFSSIEKGIYYLKLSTLDVLTYKSKSDDSNVKSAINILSKTNRIDLINESKFQLSKHYQFSNDNLNAMKIYNSVEESYRAANDNRGLIKVLNNKAMILNVKGETKKAKNIYSEQLSLARLVKDDVSIGRALVNLGGVELKLKEHDQSLIHVTEAVESFSKTRNKIGEATAHAILSDIYFRKNDIGKSVYHGKRAESIYIEAKEVTNLALTIHRLAKKYKELKDHPKAIEYFYVSEVLFTYVRNQRGNTIRQLDLARNEISSYIKIIPKEIFDSSINLGVEYINILVKRLNIIELVSLNENISSSKSN